MRRRLGLVLAAALTGTGAQASPELHPLFSDHAVLQRGRPIAIWGTAKPGERVKVIPGAASRDVAAGRNGRWRADLPAMEAGGPYRLEAAGQGGVPASADDILIGATRVRYAWADSPVVNLYDEAPLPPGPFELPID